MRRLIGIAAVTFAAACRSSSDAAVSPRLAKMSGISKSIMMPDRPGVMGLRPLADSTEEAQISKAEALFQDADVSIIDHGLRRTDIVGMSVKNPKAQAIIDEIFARRRARAASLATGARGQLRGHIDRLLVTVALVDSLADSTATAEIRRRRGIEPHDVILLPAQHATVGALEAAIHGLGKMWRVDGQALPKRDLRIAVHGEMHMRSWTPLNESLMTAQLAYAMARPRATVSGVGAVRSFTTHIVKWANTPNP
jgi:hypothetical protein